MPGLPVPLGASPEKVLTLPFLDADVALYRPIVGEDLAPPVVGAPGSAGPTVVQLQFSWPQEVRLRRRIPVPRPEPKISSYQAVLAEGRIKLNRERTFAFPAERLPAIRIIQARRDDEEFLMLL